MATYVCPKHQTEQDSWCKRCMRDFKNRPAADTMTGDERAAELERWGGVLTIPFPKVHERIEELVGRPVFTHEMGSNHFDELVEEARTWKHASPSDVLSKLPWDKEALLVTDEGIVSLP